MSTIISCFQTLKSQLWGWKDEIRDLLADLRLTMHERASTVYPVTSGIPFLGFRIYPEYRRLKRKNGINFSRRLRRYYRAFERGELSREEMTQRVRGWIAHVAQGDTWNLRRSLLSEPLPKRHCQTVTKTRS